MGSSSVGDNTGTAGVDTVIDTETGFMIFAASVFLVLLAYAISGGQNLSKLQRAPLASRLQFVNVVNMYVCFCTFIFYLGHIFGHMVHIDQNALNKITLAEYLVTCPFMQLSLAVLGGPNCKDKHRGEVASLTILVLGFGCAATVVETPPLKFLCYGFGFALFVALGRVMNFLVREHSENKMALFRSPLNAEPCPYKKLAEKIFLSWLLFPLWWLMSPDGFNLVTSSTVNMMVQTVLSVAAKGAYVLMVRLLLDKYGNTSATANTFAEANLELKVGSDRAQKNLDAKTAVGGAGITDYSYNCGEKNQSQSKDFHTNTTTTSAADVELGDINMAEECGSAWGYPGEDIFSDHKSDAAERRAPNNHREAFEQSGLWQGWRPENEEQFAPFQKCLSLGAVPLWQQRGAGLGAGAAVGGRASRTVTKEFGEGGGRGYLSRLSAQAPGGMVPPGYPGGFCPATRKPAGPASSQGEDEDRVQQLERFVKDSMHKQEQQIQTILNLVAANNKSDDRSAFSDVFVPLADEKRSQQELASMRWTERTEKEKEKENTGGETTSMKKKNTRTLALGPEDGEKLIFDIMRSVNLEEGATRMIGDHPALGA